MLTKYQNSKITTEHRVGIRAHEQNTLIDNIIQSKTNTHILCVFFSSIFSLSFMFKIYQWKYLWHLRFV